MVESRVNAEFDSQGSLLSVWPEILALYPVVLCPLYLVLHVHTYCLSVIKPEIHFILEPHENRWRRDQCLPGVREEGQKGSGGYKRASRRGLAVTTVPASATLAVRLHYSAAR